MNPRNRVREMLGACAFETRRLLVEESHSLPSRGGQEPELERVVAAMLTDAVTRSLPAPWRGRYSVERARKWIAERDAEGTTLLAVDRSTGRAGGLMILFAVSDEELGRGVDVRLGYLLSEASWGQGLASELVAGFVGWCRGRDSISSITGGVEPDNRASRRVLEKNGFQLLENADEAARGQQLFRLSL